MLIALCSCTTSQASLPQEDLEELIDGIVVDEPAGRDPVKLSMAIFPQRATPGQFLTVVIKARIAPGWRIYRHVPEIEAYIQGEWELTLSEGLIEEGGWQLPDPEPYYGTPGLYIYQGDQEFVHTIRVSDDAKDNQEVSVSLSYQTCNDDFCMPVKVKSENFKIEIF